MDKISHYLLPETSHSKGVFVFLFGFCWTLSFPPFNQSYLAWFMFVPVYHLLVTETSFVRLYSRLYVALLVAHVFTLYWINNSTLLGGILALLVNPLFMLAPLAVAYPLFKIIRQPALKILAFIFLWVWFEYGLSIWEFAFPWMVIGNSQFMFDYFIQLASLGGAWLISFIILIANFFAYQFLVFKYSPKWVSFLVGLFILTQISGYILTLSDLPSNEKLVIGVAQPHVDPWVKWDRQDKLKNMDDLLSISDSLIKVNGDISMILWPETAIEFPLLHSRGAFMLDELERFSKERQVAIATGFPHLLYYEDSTDAPPSARYNSILNEYYQYFNGATLIGPGIMPVGYGKITLVPFAERVPYADEFPAFRSLLVELPGISGWGKGQDTLIFTLPGYNNAKFPIAICYESVFPELVASTVRKGATFLTIITNDGWWGNTSGYRQHFEFARLRAIENRRWVARSANNGISGFIDPFGNVTQQTGYWVRTGLQQSIDLISIQSIYTQWGDWVPKLSLYVGIPVLIILSLLLNRRRNGDA